MSIVTGTSNYKYPKYISGIERIDIHPGFTGDLPDFLYDIAIVTLAYEITIDETQKVVGLPSSDVNVGIYGTSLGWGYTSHGSGVISDVLKMTPMMTLNNHECNQRIPTKIYEGQFCGFYSQRTGICHGDSGGPMIYNNEVIGVISVSWRCGAGYPDVYTRVYAYFPWIYGIIGRY
ncbi:brachyurin-like [Cotesia typhae]|uniref:brachyurin-like n=1 Tax=Cotesia typhae TaxID=2053667 RepID=UPI003D695F7D